MVGEISGDNLVVELVAVGMILEDEEEEEEMEEAEAEGMEEILMVSINIRYVCRHILTLFTYPRSHAI